VRAGVGCEFGQTGVASCVLGRVIVRTMVCTRGVCRGLYHDLYTWYVL